MKLKKKLIVIITAAIVVIGGLIGAYIAFSGSDLFSGGGNDIEVKLINEDTEEYMATGVSKGYVFSVETGGGAESAQVYDIEGNRTDAFCEQTDGGFDIRAPKQGYEKGGVYRIELAEGCIFKEEKLKKAKSLLFVVNKKNIADVDYTDEVKTPDSGSIEKTGNSLLLDGEYSSGDIVAADTDNDGVDELYKLENAAFNGEQTSAEYAEPDAEDVYENIDIFMYDYVDFEESDIDTEAFEGVLEETGILDAFIDSVYAAGNAGIKITSKKGDDNEYLFTAVITDPKDKKRQLTIEFGVKDKFLISGNKKMVMADNTIEITSGLEFSVSGESSAETKQKILDAIEEYTLNNEEIGDENNYEVPIIPIDIPVAGPVVADINIGLTADILFSAKLSAGIDTKVRLTQGVAVSIKKRKIVEKYAEVTGNTDAHISIEGKLNAFAGAYAEMGIKIPLLVKLSVNIKGGPYLEGQGCFSVKGIPKDIKAEGKYNIETGLTFRATGNLKILKMKKKSIKFADKRKVLAKYSNYLDEAAAMEKYAEFIKGELIPEYGLVLIGNIPYSKRNNYGIVSGLCKDINDDGLPELLVTVSETTTEMSLKTLLYGFKNDEIVLLGKNPESGEVSESGMEDLNNEYGGQTYDCFIKEIKNKYYLIEISTGLYSGGSVYDTYMTMYELNDKGISRCSNLLYSTNHGIPYGVINGEEFSYDINYDGNIEKFEEFCANLDDSMRNELIKYGMENKIDLLENDMYNKIIKFNTYDENDKSETALSRRERLWAGDYHSKVTDFTNIRELINN